MWTAELPKPIAIDPEPRIDYICLMFYRRKVILALLQAFGGELEKIRLQKLLFLFCKKQDKAEYDFIPYKFGCYSYSANADLTTMVGKKMLSETASHFKSNEKTDYAKVLKLADQRILAQVKILYGKMDSNALMTHTYKNFPFYAINSVKAEEILDKEDYRKVQNSKPQNNEKMLFTIGYEGVSVEAYLNKLIKYNIKVLVDVRSNPLSMKYGFSKSQLNKFCENLDIKYVHYPDVGIHSDHRQELNTQADYDKLFVSYKKDLPKTIATQEAILKLIEDNDRIALTCFEANICQCHRKHLAEAIESRPKFKYEVKHI